MKSMLRPFRTHRQVSHEDAFVERYGPLLAWARQITGGDRLAAEDLVHDAFVTFTLSQPNLDTIQNLDGYLFTVLRHLHLSNIRRGKHRANIECELFEYDFAGDALRAVDASRVRDELASVCQYACVRRHSSKAGSVLILRFFHGYQIAEVARVLRIALNSVDALLRTARREARCWMEDPRQLRFATHAGADEPGSIALAAPIAELGDLQRAIFATTVDACLSTSHIGRLYRADAPALDCDTLAHLVACRACLDRVNAVLDLTPLAGRHPDDSVGPGTRPPLGPATRGSRGSSAKAQREEGRQRARDIADRRPAELRIAANGIVLCGQRVNDTDVSLHVSVQVSERLGFLEVLDEEDARLLLMSVEAVPDGPIEQSARIALSGERELAVAVSFAAPWPLVTATYRLPTPIEAIATPAAAIVPVEAAPFAARDPRVDVPHVDDPGVGDLRARAPHRPRWRPWDYDAWTWLPLRLPLWLPLRLPQPVLLALGVLLLVVVTVGPTEALSLVKRVSHAVMESISDFVFGDEVTVPVPARSTRKDIALPALPPVPTMAAPRPSVPRLSERARLGLQIEVLERLDRAGALFGESLTLAEQPNGSLVLTGVVQDAARRSTILAELGALVHIPHVKVRLRAASTATTDTRTRMQVQAVEVEDRAPVHPTLEPHLARQGVTAGPAMDDALRALSSRVLDLSREAVLHTWAFRRVATQVAEDRLSTARPPTIRAWYGLLGTHAGELERLSRQLHEELDAAGLLADVTPSSTAVVVTDARSSADAMTRAAHEQDRLVRALFAASSVQGSVQTEHALRELTRQLADSVALAGATVHYCSTTVH